MSRQTLQRLLIGNPLSHVVISALNLGGKLPNIFAIKVTFETLS